MPDYYEEDKERKGDEPYEENKYSKWRVENAVETVTEAQELMSDPKMKKYMGKCIAHKKSELDKAERNLNTTRKVGRKMKEIGM
jgi:hypothetical protein